MRGCWEFCVHSACGLRWRIWISVKKYFTFKITLLALLTVTDIQLLQSVYSPYHFFYRCSWIACMFTRLCLFLKYKPPTVQMCVTATVNQNSAAMIAEVLTTHSLWQSLTREKIARKIHCGNMTLLSIYNKKPGNWPLSANDFVAVCTMKWDVNGAMSATLSKYRHEVDSISHYT